MQGSEGSYLGGRREKADILMNELEGAKPTTTSLEVLLDSLEDSIREVRGG
jgi:hypothetical protein